MNRTIVGHKDVPAENYSGAQAPQPLPDDYVTRLLKYIPSEVIVLYLTLTTLLRSSAGVNPSIEWLVFAFGVIVTPLYLWRLQRVHKALQLLISTAAFVVWAFALGGPFLHFAWYIPSYGGLLLCAYTFLIPIIEA